METLTFITDETHNKRYAQINLENIAEADSETLEEMFDIIVAEARKNEEKISLEDLEKQLKSEGRL